MREMIPVWKPEFTSEMKNAAVAALENEYMVLGESVFKFEEEFARYIGTRYAVSLNSGTAALILAFRALGLARDAEVVVPAQTFVATANGVVLAGGRPRLADVSLRDSNLDPGHLMLDGAAGMVPVHLYGNPCRIADLARVADDRGIFLVEDACQAAGSEYRGRKIGSFGTVGCFSFNPTKNMTVAGDGGMVTTNDEVVARTIAGMRDCGRNPGARYLHEYMGDTLRLNTVNAAVGRVQLRHLDTWNARRRAIAAIYNKALPEENRLEATPGATPVHQLYVMRARNRDAVAKHLEANGIRTNVHYPIPVHKQPIYPEFSRMSFPNSEKLAATVLSLPMFPALTDSQAGFIADTVLEALE